jgi:hypothetical protein
LRDGTPLLGGVLARDPDATRYGQRATHDLGDTLRAPELLTGLRGWTPQQYENWLATVIDRLLPGPDQPT